MPPVGKWVGRTAGEIVTQACPDCGRDFTSRLHTNQAGTLYTQVRCHGCRRDREIAQIKGVPFKPKTRPPPKRLTPVEGSRPEALRRLADHSVADLVGALLEKFRTQEMQLEAARTTVANVRKDADENLDLRNRLRAVEAIFRAKRPETILGRPELANDLAPEPTNGERK